LAQPTPVIAETTVTKAKKEHKAESIITVDQFFETALKIGTVCEAEVVKEAIDF